MNNILKKVITLGLGAVAGIATLTATRVDDGAWLNGEKKDDDATDTTPKMPDITEKEVEKVPEENVTVEETETK